MIELLRTFLGYCHSCRLPALVGEFQLVGWKHKFNLCEPCLQMQARKLEDAAQQMVDAGVEEGRNG